MIIEFTENEEAVYQQTVEWLSSKLNSSPPTFINQIATGFQIDPFTRTFTNDKGQSIYLTAKEFDLLYFLYSHKGRYSQKNSYMKMSGGVMIMPPQTQRI